MDLRNNQITLGELWDNPRSRAVFQKRIPMIGKHPVKGAARTVTLEQLAALYTGSADWSSVGGSGAVAAVGRESGSGTRDGFESITGTEGACKLSQELTSTGAVLQAVRSNPQAIGYAALSAVEGKEGVRAITVDGVACTEENVLDGTYAIQRPFVFVTREGEPLSETAQTFFDWAISADAAELIRAAGAVPVAK